MKQQSHKATELQSSKAPLPVTCYSLLMLDSVF